MHVYRLNSVMTSEIDPEISIIKTDECKYASHTCQEHLRYSVWAHLSFPFLPRAGDFSVYRRVLFVTLQCCQRPRCCWGTYRSCWTGAPLANRSRCGAEWYAINMQTRFFRTLLKTAKRTFLNWSVWVQSPSLCLQSSKKVSLCFVSCPHNCNFRLWICPEVISIPGVSV